MCLVKGVGNRFKWVLEKMRMKWGQGNKMEREQGFKFKFGVIFKYMLMKQVIFICLLTDHPKSIKLNII